MGSELDLLLHGLPPPEKLPPPIATKVAVTPMPLTTPGPPPTPKPPETTTEFSWRRYLAPTLDTGKDKFKMIAPDVVAELGMSVSSSLKVRCTAEKACGWTYMALSRYEGDSKYSLEFLGGVEKRDEWPFIPIDSRMSDFTLHRDEDMVTLSLESQYAMCEDKGRYLCEVKVNRTFFSKTFNVDVRKKPDPPVLTFPEDIFAGQTLWTKTTWDAGNPLIGHIVHDVVAGYRGLPMAARNERTISWHKACTIMVENRYAVTPDISWNGTVIIARILPKDNATVFETSIVERVRSDRKVMVVLDRNMCRGHRGSKLAHTYSCHKYITCYSHAPIVSSCPEAQCFDQQTGQCILQAIDGL